MSRVFSNSQARPAFLGHSISFLFFHGVPRLIFFLVMRIIGIDEAGYGPLLGPLVVAAVSFDCLGTYNRKKLWDALGDVWSIADSKVVLSHRKMAQGEETTHAILHVAGCHTTTLHSLFSSLLVRPPNFAQTSLAQKKKNGAHNVPPWFCEKGKNSFYQSFCVPKISDLPRWGKTLGEEKAEDLRKRLLTAGVKNVQARAIALCPGQLNDGVHSGLSKLDVNWKLFAELIRHDCEAFESERLVVCGKLGGRSAYGVQLCDFGLSSVIEEGRARSAYFVEGLGQIEFIRHAESFHLTIAMASMIAKLCREYILDQWHTLLAEKTPGLMPCSGYHNAVTHDYIKKTERARQQLGILDHCFLREK